MSEPITFVEGDDWRGIYVGDDLFYEGHSYPHHVIAQLCGASTIYADLDWLYERGRLPATLNEVVREL